MEEVTKYKCNSCNSVSEEEEDCCGAAREKVCSCGSEKYSKDCCDA